MLDMENIELPKLENDQKSYAGIPEAVFVEDVEAFMKQSGSEENVEKETRFLLSEQVFVKTRVPPTKTVCLWLGANVMLEYPLDEAEELLKQNKHSAEVNLKCLEHDQDFLRDQITTTEVNMARVHNYDVKKRQAKKAAEEK
ncbi:hypothetical protein RP20_CCG012494 [Aedes albopictus]|nr:hypothetical protein RP20_CCG012494 [Aedes albopictus]